MIKLGMKNDVQTQRNSLQQSRKFAEKIANSEFRYSFFPGCLK